MHPGSRYLMAEEAPGSIHHLSKLASMYDPNVFELVWENDQILFRNLTSKMTSKNTGLPCSDHLPSKTSTASGSKDRVLDLGTSRLDLYDKNKISSYQNCMQAGYPELFPELYEDDDFNVVSRNYDREQIVPVNESRTFRENHPSKMDERTPHGLMNSDSEVPQSCLKQCEASVPFNRSKEKSSGIDAKSNKVNFSIFLRSPSLIKAIYPSSEAAEPTSINGFKDVNGNMEKEVNATGSNMNVNVILPDPELLPDQQSDTVGHKDTQQNTRFVDNSKFAEQVVPSSSLCSREASNCPSYTMERRYEDNDSRKNAVEEPEGKTKTSAARGSKGAKGKRKAEVHNLSERRRRGKINKKMRALKELIPNCNKVDKASMLDEAIEYLRTLQLQVQMMSMGGGVYMPPIINPMIATSAMQQLVNAQQLGGGFFPLGFGVGMGMRMHMGVGCSQMQFPTTSVMPLSAALPGMAEARFNMVGYPSQALLMSMSMSRSPFLSSGAGRFSLPQSIHASQAAAAAIAASAVAQAKIPGGGASSIPLSTSRNSNPTYH